MKNQELVDKFRDILLKLIGDTSSEIDPEMIENTPERWIRMMSEEFLSGYKQEIDLKTFDSEGYRGMVIEKGINFSSLCLHHILPFSGEVSIASIPNQESGKIVGASKLARLVEVFSRRLQLQERMTRQIADTLWESELKPAGVMVVVEATHQCMACRGVRNSGRLVTSEVRGIFESLEARLEALRLFGGT